MPRYQVMKIIRKCFLNDDLDEDLIPIDKQSWMNRLGYFKKKLGIKKSKKKINGKDIVFKCLLELLADEDIGIDLKILEQNCSNQDIEFYIPQLCHYIIKEGRYSDMIEKFILLRASKSVSFSHQVLWNFFSGLDMGGEALSMKTVEFMQHLSDSGKNAIEKIQNTHLYREEENNSKLMAYKAIAFEHEDPLPENSLMKKLNYDKHRDLFFSTPMFISNMISTAELLRSMPQDQRKDKLLEVIGRINKGLPNNVYMPIKNFNGHRVLKVSLDYCICLHSNEKAPFHILIEVENISLNNIRSSIVHEVEETKRQNTIIRESFVSDTIGSHDSFEDNDESSGLKLSSESNQIASYEDSDDDLDDSHMHPFADHYAEDLLGSEKNTTQQLDLHINPKKFEESKIMIRSSSEIQATEASSVDYKLARIVKRKPTLFRRVFLCHCDDEEVTLPIINHELEEFSKEKKSKPKSNPIGLFGRKKFDEIREEIKNKSEFGHLPQWDLISVIVKSGENIQQEKFASFLMQKFHSIFQESKINCWLRPFAIIATSPIGGIVETVTDAVSIDNLKKSYPEMESLRTYYVQTFGGSVKSRAFKKARKAFVRSLAGYSLLCYILQIKDRHNANILIDSKGHVVHVDFGFMLSNSPGSMNFEASSFKLTAEFVDIMGGQRSQALRQFKALMIKGFMALRKNAEKIMSFVEMTMLSNPNMSCFQRGPVILEELRDRFKLDLSSTDCKDYMYDLIEKSTDNWRTRWYDKYQRLCVGVW